MSKEEGKLDISFGEGALEIGMLNKLQKKSLIINKGIEKSNEDLAFIA